MSPFTLLQYITYR